MDIFGKQQIEQLNARIDYLAANASRLEKQITDCAQQRDEALKLLATAQAETTKAKNEATTARQSLAEFEASLKRSIAKLGGLLSLGDDIWLDPQSVAEIKIQHGELWINGHLLKSGPKSELLPLATKIAEARGQISSAN